MKIVSMNEFEGSEYIKMLVYGNSGVGKTVLCSTLPNPLVISSESGLLSLKKSNLIRVFGEDNEYVNYNVDTLQIESADDLAKAYTWLKKSKEAEKYETVALDSLSEIGEVVLLDLKAKYKDARLAYMELADTMAPLIRSFRDLNKHVYFSAKLEVVKNEGTGEVKEGPMMPGTKFASRLPYFFDEVFKLDIGKGENGELFRYLQTQPTNVIVAKDRSGSLERNEAAILSYIIQKIQNS